MPKFVNGWLKILTMKSFFSLWIFIGLILCTILLFENCTNAPENGGEVDGEVNAKQNASGISEEDRQKYLERGRNTVKMTFGALSSALMEVMSEEGVVPALEYCNLAALPITDSVAEEFQVEVQRLAEKNRNPANAIVNPIDRKIFSELKSLTADELEAFEKLKELKDGTVAYYKPILLQPQCMACHGPREIIGEDNYLAIKSLYPEDKAYGFQTGDLRGMWKVSLLKSALN